MRPHAKNRKIVNAEATLYDGISFKSKLEVTCYKVLKGAGIPFEYENIKFVLQKGFYLTDSVMYYHPGKKGKRVKTKTKLQLDQYKQKLRSITYTPDFTVRTKKRLIIVDVKGYSNDVYMYKLKLLLNLLLKRADGIQYIIYEPHNLTQITQMARDIKGFLLEDE